MLTAQLLFALLESARNIEFYRVLQVNTDSVLESLFADYASPLWEDYRLLGMTAAGSGGQFSLNNREAMFREISQSNLSSGDGLFDRSRSSLLTADTVDIAFDEYLLLTDRGGKVFQAAVTSYMKNNLGYEAVKSVYDSYEAAQDAKDQYGGKDTAVEDALDVLDELREGESTGEESDTHAAAGASVPPLLGASPKQSAEEKKDAQEAEELLTTVVETQKSGVLSLVLPEGASLSGSQMRLKQAVSHRSLQEGNSCRELDGAWYDKVLFHQYLLRYLSCYTDGGDGRGLNYELEYLIGGKSADDSNLKLVVAELLAVREALNLASLTASAQKQSQAWEMAVLLAGATANPAIVEAVKWGLLAAWAYAESVLDLRTLLQGGKIAVTKSDADWTSHLEAVPTLLSGWSQAKSCETGITYKDYLGMLILAHNSGKLAMRAMDVQEAAIRKKEGYETFRMDSVICEADIQAVYEYVPVFSGFVTLLGAGTGRIRILRKAHYSYLLGKAGA